VWCECCNDHGKTLQLGVVVSEDGYVLTKASEAPVGHRFRLAWADGRGVARVVRVDTDLDLLLAKSDRDAVLAHGLAVLGQNDLGRVGGGHDAGRRC